MARGNLFPSHFPEHFCLFVFREEAEEVSRAKLCIRVGNQRLSASFDFHKDCVRQRRNVRYFPAVQKRPAADGDEENVLFLSCFRRRRPGEGFLQERIVDGFAAEKLCDDIGEGTDQRERHKMIEIPGHFQDKHRPRDGRAYAGGEEGCHAEDDHVREIYCVQKAQSGESRAFRGAQESAQDKQGKEEASRNAAAVGNQGENVLSCKEKEKKGQTVRSAGQHIDETVSAAENGGKENPSAAAQKSAKRMRL